MFPRPHRLNKEWEIKKVFKQGRQLHSPLFTLFFVPKYKNCRIKIIVSKKHSKLAVHRNKLRRRFQEAAHHLVVNFPLASNLVILPKKRAEQANFKYLQKELTKIFTDVRTSI
jgi:ribonuclease P protein component